MKAAKKKQNKLTKIFGAISKAVNSIAGLLDKIKMDEDIRNTKKKAFKVLLYSIITLVTTFCFNIIISLFLENFQQSIIDFGVDPNNNIIVDTLSYVGVISIFTITLSSLVVIGSKKCDKCFPRTRKDDNWSTNPSNPASASYQLMHRQR